MRERLVADHKKLLTKYKIDDSLMFDSITEKLEMVWFILWKCILR